jgi:hypothetical protein
MLDEAVERTLQRTVDWLLKGNDAPSWWAAHTDHAEMCLSEMLRMSQQVDAPGQAVLLAVPHVRIMVAAMLKRTVQQL